MRCRQALRETGAKILGMTVMPGPQLSDAVPICKALKAEFPGLTIIWGGYFPSLHCGVVMKAPYVDYVFRGHCEHEFVTFMRRFQRGEDVTDLIGLAWRTPDGEVKMNAKAPLPNINELPDFPYDRVPMERYMRNSFMGSRTVAHHSSYGCPFTCNFCGVVYKVNGRYSAQTAERTASVVQKLVRDYRVNAVEFYDSNFFVQESRIAEFSERITPLNIGWWGFGRPDTMLKFSDKTWAAMAKSGLEDGVHGRGSRRSGNAPPDEQGRQADTRHRARGCRENGALRCRARDVVHRRQPARSGGRPAKDAAVHPQIEEGQPEDRDRLLRFHPGSGGRRHAARGARLRVSNIPRASKCGPRRRGRNSRSICSSSLPWMTNRIRRKVSNFQQVLHAAYPTITDPKLTGLGRAALRSVASWRYATEFYDFPIELKVVNKLFPYNRPEISGF